ncbi:unnamed protein product [Boreogadus saida]
MDKTEEMDNPQEETSSGTILSFLFRVSRFGDICSAFVLEFAEMTWVRMNLDLVLLLVYMNNSCLFLFVFLAGGRCSKKY